MRLYQHANGIYYCEFNRSTRESLRTRDREEAERKFNELKGNDFENKYEDLLIRTYDFRISRGDCGPGTVYFLQAGGEGLIKIGYTKDLYHRHVSIQTSSPVKVTLIGYIPNCSIEIERGIQHRFRELRLHGEWFIPDKKLMRFIRNATVIPD